MGCAVESEQHLRALEKAGETFARYAEDAPSDAPVPTCPGWDVAQLIRHLGLVHRWAAAIVSQALIEPLRLVAAESQAADSTGDLVRWFREGHQHLLRTLRAAPSDLHCWTIFAGGRPRAFWCRRQAHETAMHAADLALASGHPVPSPPSAVAADGIDELLGGILRGRPPAEGADDGPHLRVVACDHPVDWQIGFPGRWGVTLIPGTEATRSAEAVVRGTAGDLELLLWNRRSSDGLQVEGDPAVLAAWRDRRQVH